jgi:uncharacterized protein YkwD
VSYSRGTGENVADTDRCDNLIRAMVDGWTSSPGHRNDLLRNFTIKTAFNHRGNLWHGTQFFGLLES